MLKGVLCTRLGSGMLPSIEMRSAPDVTTTGGSLLYLVRLLGSVFVEAVMRASWFEDSASQSRLLDIRLMEVGFSFVCC